MLTLVSDKMLLSRLNCCDSGCWRWQLKTCWWCCFADIGIEGSVKDRFDNLATTGQVEIFGQGWIHFYISRMDERSSLQFLTVNSQRNSQNWSTWAKIGQNFAFFMLKSTLTWKSTHISDSILYLKICWFDFSLSHRDHSTYSPRRQGSSILSIHCTQILNHILSPLFVVALCLITFLRQKIWLLLIIDCLKKTKRKISTV